MAELENEYNVRNKEVIKELKEFQDRLVAGKHLDKPMPVS